MKRAFLLIALLGCSVAAAQTPPDLILFNGRVFGPNSPEEFAQAIAITGNRITAVGTNEEVLALAHGTRRIDVGGRLVIPGINDAHVHFEIFPPGFIVTTSPDATLDLVTAAIAGAVDETPAGVFIFGTIGPPVLLDPNATKAALDAAAPGRRVMLTADSSSATRAVRSPAKSSSTPSTACSESSPTPPATRTTSTIFVC
jgi:predicted amidohydrolase YtcJ